LSTLAPTIALISLLLLIQGCSPTPSDPDADSQAHSKETSIDKDRKIEADKSELPKYASVISEGLSEMNYVSLPIGRVHISDNSEHGRYVRDLYLSRGEPAITTDYLAQLEEVYAKLGLISCEKLPWDNDKGQFYKFAVTQRAKDLADPNRSNDKELKIRLGTRTVIQIIKDEPFKHPSLPKSDDYLLCVGAYRFEPTEIGKESYKAMGHELFTKYKFRAVIKFNPFTNSYSFVTSDWGYLDKDNWESKNIP